jgi:large subunit ribosomal protein L34e
MPGPKSRSKKVKKIEREGRFGRFKARAAKRLQYVKVPGGRTVIHFKTKKPSKAKCSDCKGVLAGVPREVAYKMKNMPKTKKRPERPYGGVLCSKCMRKKMIEDARNV